MPPAEKRSVTLPPEQARYVDALVASGDYESDGAVMRAALRALQARDAAMERWVRSQVVPVLGALQPTPTWIEPEDQLTDAVRRRHAAWLREAMEERQD